MSSVAPAGRFARTGGRWCLPAVLAVEILLFLPSLFTPGLIRAPVPKISESTSLFYPWQMFWRDEVLAGRPPFWNPYIFGGMPIVGEPQAQTFYPGHLLWLTFPPEAAFKLSLLLHLLLGSWLMYRLTREIGASRFGAAIAGLVFGLHGQMIGFAHAGWIHQVTPMAWAPGVIWMLCRAFRDPRRWPGGPIFGASALLGLQIISGHPEWVRYTLFIAAILTLGGRALGRTLGARLMICAAAVSIGLLIGGLQLLPMAQAARHSARAQDAAASGAVRVGAGLPILTLPTVLVPRLFGPWDESITADGLIHKLSGSLVNYSESLIYVGVMPLLLAFMAWRWRPTGAGVWAAVAMIGVLLALNDRTFLLSAFDRIVTIDSVFRSPARFVFLANFALAVLAGLGASRVEQTPGDALKPARPALTIAIGLAVVGGLAWVLRPTLVSYALSRVSVPLYVAQYPIVAVDGGRALGMWAVGRTAFALCVAALILAVTSVILRRAARQFDGLTRALILACIAADLGFFAYPLLTNVVPTQRAYAHDGQVLAPVAGRWSARITAPHLAAFEAGDNASMIFGVRSMIGYDSFSLAEWDRLWRVMNHASPDALAALGITHVVDWDASDRRTLSPLPKPRGHAWWTDHVVVAPTPDASADLLASLSAGRGVALDHASTDVGNTVIPDDPAGGSVATVRIDEDVPGRLRAIVTAPRSGWLVVTEMIYPGWTARVNGQAAPIERAFGAMQAVRVPPGTSVVDLAFRPSIVWWGAGTTGLGLLAGLVMMGIGRRPYRDGASRI